MQCENEVTTGNYLCNKIVTSSHGISILKVVSFGISGTKLLSQIFQVYHVSDYQISDYFNSMEIW